MWNSPESRNAWLVASEMPPRSPVMSLIVRKRLKSSHFCFTAPLEMSACQAGVCKTEAM